MKAIVLRHHTPCSDTTHDCVECVIRMYRDLLQAYEAKELLLYHSNLDIVKREYGDGIAFKKKRCEFLINDVCSVSALDSWETFIMKITEV